MPGDEIKKSGAPTGTPADGSIVPTDGSNLKQETPVPELNEGASGVIDPGAKIDEYTEKPAPASLTTTEVPPPSTAERLLSPNSAPSPFFTGQHVYVAWADDIIPATVQWDPTKEAFYLEEESKGIKLTPDFLVYEKLEGDKRGPLLGVWIKDQLLPKGSYTYDDKGKYIILLGEDSNTVIGMQRVISKSRPNWVDAVLGLPSKRVHLPSTVVLNDTTYFVAAKGILEPLPRLYMLPLSSSVDQDSGILSLKGDNPEQELARIDLNIPGLRYSGTENEKYFKVSLSWITKQTRRLSPEPYDIVDDIDEQHELSVTYNVTRNELRAVGWKRSTGESFGKDRTWPPTTEGFNTLLREFLAFTQGKDYNEPATEPEEETEEQETILLEDHLRELNQSVIANLGEFSRTTFIWEAIDGETSYELDILYNDQYPIEALTVQAREVRAGETWPHTIYGGGRATGLNGLTAVFDEFSARVQLKKPPSHPPLLPPGLLTGDFDQPVTDDGLEIFLEAFASFSLDLRSGEILGPALTASDRTERKRGLEKEARQHMEEVRSLIAERKAAGEVITWKEVFQLAHETFNINPFPDVELPEDWTPPPLPEMDPTNARILRSFEARDRLLALPQLHQSRKRLKSLPDFSKGVDERKIEGRVDTIHETLTTIGKFLEEVEVPLADIAQFSEVKEIFKRLLDNLAAIIKAAPRWIGIQLFSRQLARGLESLYGKKDPEIAEMITTVLQSTETTPDYRRLFPDSDIHDALNILFPEISINEEISDQFYQIKPKRLTDEAYRKELAKDLFDLSRGYPALARAIVMDLYELVQTEATRPKAILLLREFIEISKGFGADDALLVRDYSEVTGTREPFYLLTTPTIFPPENWTATMLDGLRKEEIKGQTLMEVGTGSGILPIYVAKHLGPQKVYSYDLNPDAQYVATLNAWLASTDKDGNLLLGTQPIHRLEFGHTPNLLQGAPRDLKVDIIFGCIPQVPSEDTLTHRNIADRYESKGYPEDVDGLGLLAELLDQADSHLSKDGRVVLIVSGRPGLEAVQQMANRRGFVPWGIHETVFEQDKWTDLSSYVQIEKDGFRSPFEFQLGDTQITAADAEQILKEYQDRMKGAKTEGEKEAIDSDEGYKVTHRQFVVQFRPIDQFHEAWKSMADKAVTSFIAENRRIGYTEDTGSEYEPYREEMSHHLSSITGIQIPEETLFIGPSINSLIYNFYLTTTGRGEKIYIDRRFDLDPHLELSLGESNVDRNDESSSRLRIIPLPSENENASAGSSLFEELEKACKEKKFTLFIAGPETINSLSNLTSYLRSHPEHSRFVSILWQNTDLPVGETPLATMILWNEAQYETMAQLAEDTYSRIPTLRAVHETSLLQSHRKAGYSIDVSTLPETLETIPGVSKEDVNPWARELSSYKSHPSTLPETLADSTIDMSFGESEFPLPEESLTRLAKGLGERAADLKVRELLIPYLKETGRGEFHINDIRLGAGVHPLIETTLRYIGKEEPFRVMVPAGTYGQFFSTIHAAGGNEEVFDIDLVETDIDKLKEALERAYSNDENAGEVRALLLPYPTNPAGRFYSQEAFRTLVEFCVKRGIYILADEIFLGTARTGDQTSAFQFLHDSSLKTPLQTMLIGYSGLSKEFALGGARFGFMYSHNRHLLTELSRRELTPVDDSSLALAQTIYDLPVRHEYTEAHLEWLEEKREQMVDFLTPYVNEDLIKFPVPQGGYFVEVNVFNLIGLEIEIDGNNYEIEKGNLREVLYKAVGIKISPLGWSGNLNTIRLVYSIEKLDEALTRLQIFFDACVKAWDSVPGASGASEAAKSFSPSPAQGSSQVKGREHWPAFIDEEELRSFMQSADGRVRVGEISASSLGDDFYELVLQLIAGEDKEIGSFIFKYKPDFDQKGKYHASNANIEISDPDYTGNYYGFELTVQSIRYRYHNPKLSWMQLIAAKDGIHLWKNFDGFKLEEDDIIQAFNKLDQMQRVYGFEIDRDQVPDDIDLLRSPLRLSRLIDLGAPDKRLMPLARKVYATSGWSKERILEKTRYPLELALLHLVAYSATLDLTPGNKDYASFERSVAEFWESRELEPRNTNVPEGFFEGLEPPVGGASVPRILEDSPIHNNRSPSDEQLVTSDDVSPKASADSPIMGIGGVTLTGQNPSEFSFATMETGMIEVVNGNVVEIVHEDLSSLPRVIPAEQGSSNLEQGNDFLSPTLDSRSQDLREAGMTTLPLEWETTLLESIALAERKSLTEVVYYLEFASDKEIAELFTTETELCRNLIENGYVSLASQLSQSDERLSQQQIIQLNAALISGAPTEVHSLIQSIAPETPEVIPSNEMMILGTTQGSITRMPTVLRVVR